MEWDVLFVVKRGFFGVCVCKMKLGARNTADDRPG